MLGGTWSCWEKKQPNNPEIQLGQHAVGILASPEQAQPSHHPQPTPKAQPLTLSPAITILKVSKPPTVMDLQPPTMSTFS